MAPRFTARATDSMILPWIRDNCWSSGFGGESREFVSGGGKFHLTSKRRSQVGYKGLELAGEVWFGKVNLGEASTRLIFIDKNRVRCGQRVMGQGDE